MNASEIYALKARADAISASFEGLRVEAQAWPTSSLAKRLEWIERMDALGRSARTLAGAFTGFTGDPSDPRGADLAATHDVTRGAMEAVAGAAGERAQRWRAAIGAKIDRSGKPASTRQPPSTVPNPPPGTTRDSGVPATKRSPTSSARRRPAGKRGGDSGNAFAEMLNELDADPSTGKADGMANDDQLRPPPMPGVPGVPPIRDARLPDPTIRGLPPRPATPRPAGFHTEPVGPPPARRRLRQRTALASLAGLLGEIDGEDREDGRRGHGRPNRAKVAHDARASKRAMALSRPRLDRRIVDGARSAVESHFAPAFHVALPPADPLDLARMRAWRALHRWALGATAQTVIAAITRNTDPLTALSQAGIEQAFRAANAATGSLFDDGQIRIAAKIANSMIGDKVKMVMMLPAVLALLREARDPRPRQGESDGETGWDVARRRLSGAAPDRHGKAAAKPPAPAAASPAAASAARKRIRAATMPAFATALDTAVSPDLIVRFVGTRPGKPDLAGLRHAHVAAAVRHFAADFVRTISSAPQGTSETLALGAIIATALSQAGRQFPIVPPAAVPAMSVLIHKSLQPRLAELARMAATIAAAPSARPAPTPAGAMREMAW